MLYFCTGNETFTLKKQHDMKCKFKFMEKYKLGKKSESKMEFEPTTLRDLVVDQYFCSGILPCWTL